MAFVYHLIIHTFEDVIFLIPYLYGAYLIIEYIEYHAHTRIRNFICSTRRLAPFVGAILAPISGCGLSAIAANFYVTRLISLGTLIAIYLSTADEMLPLLFSAGVAGTTICKILIFKIVFATLVGFVLDLYTFRTKQSFEIKEFCEHNQCGCHHDGILKSALIHTIHITIFIFTVSFILNALFELTEVGFLNDLISRNPISSIFMAAIAGLIPNCAVSVGLTQLYVENILPISVLISGLSANAGVGLLVFYKISHSIKETIKIAGLLFISAVLSGNLALFILG